MNSNAELNMIAALDLDPIKVKLMHKESGEGWSLERANAVEFEYRRFLCLMKLFPNEQAAPLFDVDIFWHYHILDTMKYAIDCDHIFGYFLHHFPYSGLHVENDEAARYRVGARTQELYETTFGEAYIRQKEVAQNDKYYWARPVTGAASAFCETVTQNDRVYFALPALGMAKTAFCETVAQNDPVYSARPALGTAFCETVAQSTTQVYSARPVPAPAKTAFCETVAQNDSAYLVRPLLANAA